MNFSRLWGSGGAANGQDTAAAAEEEVTKERLFGLQNFGNTCYANSVLQALYFCEPFRDRIKVLAGSPPVGQAVNGNGVADRPHLKQPPSPVKNGDSHLRSASANSQAPHTRKVTSNSEKSPTMFTSNGKDGKTPAPALLDVDLDAEADPNTTLFATLRDLFGEITENPNKTGVVAPRAFIQQLKRENELFRSTMHQDAHEFLNYLLNAIAEELEKQEKERIADGLKAKPVNGNHRVQNGRQNNNGLSRSYSTWIHSLFEGVLTNETRCLTCETVTSRDESFLDLSIDIDEHTSVTSCLRQFSASEMLCSKNKFSCDTCCGLQEAEKRMKIKHLPDILALHLKRFKWQEDVQRFAKLNYRVVFPFELRLFNTVDSSPDADRLYSLWAIVVHIGAGPHHGHYICLIKSNGRWLCFDDDTITQIDEATITKYYGDAPGNGAGYVLFYQAADLQPAPEDDPMDVAQTPTEDAKDNSTQAINPLTIKTGGLSLSRPSNLQIDPIVSPISAQSQPSPARERKSFFGLQSRKSLTSRPDELKSSASSNRGSSAGRDPSPGSSRRVAMDSFEPSPPPAVHIDHFPPVRLTSAPQTDQSDAASFSTSSSGNFSAYPASAGAAPLAHPSLPHSITAPNIRHAVTTSETSPQRPVLVERKTLGRLFGRTKSMRVASLSESSATPYELDSQMTSSMTSEDGDFGVPMDKRQLKEQLKREKENLKATAKREKEEAKRGSKSR